VHSFQQRNKERANDLEKRIHFAPACSEVTALSRAVIKPMPAIVAAMTAPQSATVVGSLSNIAVRALPTATRIAPMPAVVVRQDFMRISVLGFETSFDFVQPTLNV
jgi:hypothetical protein